MNEIRNTIFNLKEGCTLDGAIYPLMDLDGNEYTTVEINGQEWIVENFRCTQYENGDPIATVSTDLEWVGLTSGGYCAYNNNSGNIADYGLLYNAFCGIDNAIVYLERNGIKETGWRIPSKTDFDNLSAFYSTNSRKVKEIGTTHWQSPNTGADNASGLTLRGAGIRDSGTGAFMQLTQYNYLWSNTYGANYGGYETYYQMTVRYDTNLIVVDEGNQLLGASVRLVRDL